MIAGVLERGVALLDRRIATPLVRLLPRSVTPNHLSLLRLSLAGVVGVLLSRGAVLSAFLWYLVAILSDALDGALARERNAHTALGARLDPTVDKVLHAVVFVAFLSTAPGLLLATMAVDALLALLGLALVLRRRRAREWVAASVFGKWKLTLQAVAVLGLFWNPLVPSLGLPGPLVSATLALALFFAALSVIGYARQFATDPSSLAGGSGSSLHWDSR